MIALITQVIPNPVNTPTTENTPTATPMSELTASSLPREADPVPELALELSRRCC